MRASIQILFATLLLAFAGGCTEEGGEPMDTVKQVDLERFMGDWYVIANIPTFVEKGAYNAVESYALNPDGTIATTFTFNKGGFDGPLKTHNPKGFVRDNTNALWWMQFIWPIKADFRIVWLEPDYSITVIARSKRDYVWIMAREPSIPQAKYDEIVAFIGGLGYDTGKIQKVPQRQAD
jgi:apolipoprotein D and lipocalin family protein